MDAIQKRMLEIARLIGEIRVLAQKNADHYNAIPGERALARYYENLKGDLGDNRAGHSLENYLRYCEGEGRAVIEDFTQEEVMKNLEYVLRYINSYIPKDKPRINLYD